MSDENQEFEDNFGELLDENTRQGGPRTSTQHDEEVSPPLTRIATPISKKSKTVVGLKNTPRSRQQRTVSKKIPYFGDIDEEHELEEINSSPSKPTPNYKTPQQHTKPKRGASSSKKTPLRNEAESKPLQSEKKSKKKLY